MDRRKRFLAMMLSGGYVPPIPPLPKNYLISSIPYRSGQYRLGTYASGAVWADVIAAANSYSWTNNSSNNQSISMHNGILNGQYFCTRFMFQINSTSITNATEAWVCLESSESNDRIMNMYGYQYLPSTYFNGLDYSRFGVQYLEKSEFVGNLLTPNAYYKFKLTSAAINALNTGNSVYILLRGWEDVENIIPTHVITTTLRFVLTKAWVEYK